MGCKSQRCRAQESSVWVERVSERGDGIVGGVKEKERERRKENRRHVLLCVLFSQHLRYVRKKHILAHAIFFALCLISLSLRMSGLIWSRYSLT